MSRRGGAVQPRPQENDGTAGQGRIPFLLKIGVTGHRKLSEDDALRKAVHLAVEYAISWSGYRESGLPDKQPRLTVVSPLAEGADRLVAGEVLDNWAGSLVCVLPVNEQNLGLYRADFDSDESRRDFDELRGRAWRQIEPTPGLVPADATQEQRDAGYLWAGRQVALNSDVIIAIWDGQPGHGVGGTADLIRWLRLRDTGPAGLPPEDPVLGQAGPLRIIVRVDAGQEPHVTIDDAAPYDVAAATVKERLKGDMAGLKAFNKKTFDPADWRRWMEEVAGQLAPEKYRQSPRLRRILEQIAPPFIRADQAAISAQQWFNISSYALFGFTALATILAALQAIVLTDVWGLTFTELALIVASILIVAWERVWKNNNKHWFVDRFFAERLRTAFYLLAVGHLPETNFDVGGTTEKPTQNDWVRRAFTGVLAEGDAATTKPAEDPRTLSSLIREHWMRGQLRYFERRSTKMMRQHLTIVSLLYAVLGATIIAVLLHSLQIWPFDSGQTQALIMCAIGLPAVAAALSNIRSLREFSRHAFRYQRTAAVVSWYLSESVKEPSIEDLGVLAERVASLFTVETRGWLLEVSEHHLEMAG
jgi:hypothetical protein